MPRASEKESFPAKIGDLEIEIECDFTKTIEINRRKKLEGPKNEDVAKYYNPV